MGEQFDSCFKLARYMLTDVDRSAAFRVHHEAWRDYQEDIAAGRLIINGP